MARIVVALAAIGTVAFFVGFASARSGAAGDPELQSIGNFAAPIFVSAPPGDGERVFVVQKGGLIRIVKNGATLGTPFLDLTGPVRSAEYERGLLSMAFAPDYAATGRFYVYYTADAVPGVRGLGDLIIAEYHRSANPDVADPAERVVVQITHPRENHNGGQLQFGPDGYLYIGTGDGGGANDPDDNGQNLNALLGKLLRIDPRAGPSGEPYTIPATNPFVGQAGRRGEIWSYGLRNPWRFSFDRATGDLTIADVGQNEWEEIDFVPATAGAGRGTNFGWECFEGRHDYDNDPPWCSPRPSNHTPPVHEYGHGRGRSITGGYVVRDLGLPALYGRYVYGDALSAPIWSIVLQTPDASGDAQTGLSVPDVFSFGEDACGRVYIASGAGPVYRLGASGSPSPATCTPAAQPPGPPPPPAPPPPPVSPPPPAKPKVICRVPRVVGYRVAKARTRIRRANCRVGRVRFKRSARARGRVVSQSPRRGARRPRGFRVKFVVSRGRR
jgi:Glucose / Sorbosone dehydrogenase/PASTA domain